MAMWQVMMEHLTSHLLLPIYLQAHNIVIKGKSFYLSESIF